MKPTLEAMLENFRERGAENVAFRPGNAHTLRDMPAWQYSRDDYRAGHDALAPLLVKAVDALVDIELDPNNNDWEEEAMRMYRCAKSARKEIEAALAQGTEARGEGEKR